MVNKIEQVATDYFCCYQIHTDWVDEDFNQVVVFRIKNNN